MKNSRIPLKNPKKSLENIEKIMKLLYDKEIVY